MFKPKPLFPGAYVALVAPAGPVPQERLAPAVSAVKALGLNPVVFESSKQAHGYFGGTDNLRAQNINAAFADDSIDGILCIRGGYGTQRLLDAIDYDVVCKRPKFFSGYSDITALHIAFNQLCNLRTYHTPMPSTEWYKGLDAFTQKSLCTALFGTQPLCYQNPQESPLQTLYGGTAAGILTGGNLSLVASSLGTPYEIETEGRILFLEDVEEEPYSIDRMLTHLRNAGKLSACAGIVLGYWTDCTAEHPERSLTLEQVFAELLKPLGIPVLTGLACGHSLPSLSLELGGTVLLDADKQTLTPIESFTNGGAL